MHDSSFTRPPSDVGEVFDALSRFGGYPEPFLRGEVRFWNRWRRTRSRQLLREELRDLTRIRDLPLVEHLAELLVQRVSSTITHASLARDLHVTVETAQRWVTALTRLYHGFTIRPWYRNVPRALRKEPKYYLWDWSQLSDPGARAENMVASALLKAVHFWSDHGLADCSLHYLRDKDKHEVDFLVVRDETPWFLVEVKAGARAGLSPALARFQVATQAPHAFQVAMDMPYVDRDVFEQTGPIIVPARTLLSQLV